MDCQDLASRAMKGSAAMFISLLLVLQLGLPTAYAGEPPQKVMHQEVMMGGAMWLESGTLWKDCMPPKLIPVSSTEDVVTAIKQVYEEVTEEDKELVARVSRSGYLSHNNFTCPENTGPYSPQAVVLDVSRMKAVLSRDTGSITVQAGITFQELEEELLAHNQGLPAMVLTPQLADMSVGGALMTGSHGSSLVGPASIAPFIKHAVIVDGTGHVHELDQAGSLLEGSLGLLGVLTQLTLQVGPARKVAVTELQAEDAIMVSELKDVVENTKADALDVTWSPAAGMYSARLWREAEPSTAGDARNVYLQGTSGWVKKVNKKLVADQQDYSDSSGAVCSLLGELASGPHFSYDEPGKKKKKINKKGKKGAAAEDASQQATSDTEKTQSEGGDGDAGTAQQHGQERLWVGWPGRMAGIRCPSAASCLWKKSKYTPYELAISSEDLESWVDDVKQIFKQAKGCPSFLIQFRFMAASSAPLALSAGRQTVSIELSTHSGVGPGLHIVPPKHPNVWEEVVQMSLCKYKARPNWGLASSRMFLHPTCRLKDTIGADHWAKFTALQKQYDPDGLFVPPLWREIASRSKVSPYPRCAPLGDCFCTSDEHCAEHHKCVPGSVFKEYKVCMASQWLKEEL